MCGKEQNWGQKVVVCAIRLKIFAPVYLSAAASAAALSIYEFGRTRTY